MTYVWFDDPLNYSDKQIEIENGWIVLNQGDGSCPLPDSIEDVHQFVQAIVGETGFGKQIQIKRVD